jgi:RES domain-containing protein
MKRLFRITKTKFSSQAFSGQGAAEYPGRWNLFGFPVVYTSDSVSLACLETLSHLYGRIAAAKYSVIEAQLPDEWIEFADIDRLPIHWDADEAPLATQEFGSEWLESMRSPVLGVPSILVPNDLNFLVNPRHPLFPKIAIGPARPFKYHRLLTNKRRGPAGR